MSVYGEARNIQKLDADPPGDPEKMDANTKEAVNLCEQVHIMILHRQGEGIHSRLAELIAMWVSNGILVSPVMDSFGGFIEITRTNQMHHFLASSSRRFVLLIDNDTIPKDPNIPLLMARHNQPVVSGVVCAFRPNVGIFACIAVKDKTGVARFPSKLETKKLPYSGLVELDSCGAACLMIRRDVIETMMQKDPGIFFVSNEMRLEAAKTGVLRLSEDISFCHRAKKLGYNIYADLEAHCWHDKNVVIDWDEASRDHDLDVKDWDVTTFAPTKEMLG